MERSAALGVLSVSSDWPGRRNSFSLVPVAEENINE